MSLKATLNAAGAMSIAISLLYSQSPTPPAVPTGTLTGTVRDQTRKVAIGGAKVQVLNAAGAVRGIVRTGKDGKYKVPGLTLGETVNAVYSAAGYAPDPWSRPLKISQAEVVQDVALLCDCTDSTYWKSWAEGVKALADEGSKDPAEKARKLNESWASLGYIGISAEARGAAARNLVAVEPITGKFPAILGFANADPLVLRKTEQLVRVKLSGGAAEGMPSVPPEIAAEIAAVEVRKQSKAGDRALNVMLEQVIPIQARQYVVGIIDTDAAMKVVSDRMVIVK